MLGTRVVRKEDPRLLTEGGLYVDDIAPTEALHATFVRSVMPHAKILGIDTAEALAMPGVVAVFTAADLDQAEVPPSMPFLNQEMTRTWLATDRVRYVGESVAVIISETRNAGVDATEMIIVDYEPLDAVIDMHEAAKEVTLLYPEVGTNTIFGFPAETDGMFDDCEVVVDLTFKNPRMSVAAMEPRGAVSEWSSEDGGEPRLTHWACTQFPHNTRDGLAQGLGLEPDRVRVITPDVGGGFGGKNATYHEDFLVAVIARQLDKPVRWTETRSESMLNLAHGRACEFAARIGGSRDGNITAYNFHVIQDGGAYPAVGSVLPMFHKIMACGVYDMDNVQVSAQSVVTNSTPVGAYRGAGRPEATHAIERMVDAFAREIEMDPAEVRRKNFVAPGDFPRTTLTGADMDSGEYEKALDKVIEAADYAGLRAEQEQRRSDPSAKLLGLGWSTYVEITNPVNAPEFGSVELRPDGTMVVLTGSSSHGQGHRTAFSQVVSTLTGLPIDKIEVHHGDTDEVARGGGTGGSRSLQVGGTAIHQSTEKVIDMALEQAATILEANPDDLSLDTESGSFAVVGTPAKAVSWAEVAEHVDAAQQPGLQAESDFQPESPTFPFGAHLSVVEVDRDTGQVTVLRHVACDDAGLLVNPMIVDGQVHGGVAAGIAQAVMEEFVYDEDGNPQTGNFMDYGILSAAELPSFERLEMETPTDRNPLGVKGIGEAGTIGATPAVQNAVIDALAHLGVRHVDIPTTPMNVWQAMQDAGSTN